MKRILSYIPWNILIPVILVAGLAVSIWGGIYLLHDAREDWKKERAFLAVQKTADMHSSWLSFTSNVKNVVNTVAVQNKASQLTSFAGESSKLLKAYPFIEGLVWKAGAENYIAGDLDITQIPMNSSNIKVKEFTFVAPSLTKTDQANVPLLYLRSGNVSLWGKVNPNSFINNFIGKSEGVQLKLSAQNSSGKTIADIITGDNSIISAVHSHTELLNLGGLNWQLDWLFVPTPASKPNYVPGQAVFGLGFILTILYAWVMWAQTAINRKIRGLVEERTLEVEQINRRFRLVTDNAYDLIAIVTTQGHIDYVNSTFHKLVGLSRGDLQGKHFIEYIHPKDVDLVRTVIADLANGSGASEVSFRMRTKHGGWLHLEAVGKALHDGDWNLERIAIHCRDITARKQYADNLARSEQRFKDFSESSADWLWEFDSDLKFTYISNGVQGVMGYDSDEMLSITFDRLFDKNGDSTRDLIESRIQRHQAFRDIEFWTTSKQGERVCLRVSGVPVFDENQSFGGYRGAATNITASKLDRDNMFRLATTDHLTKLLNRNRFSEELERTVSLATRHNSKGVLVFIDLDRFKEINDTHGHEAGDAILGAVASILKTSLRNTDVVARLGGDEFGVIMHNISVDQARDKVQQIIDRINELRVEYKGARLHVTMSIGLVTYPQENKSSTDLIMGADLAMYRAKDMGRNRMFIDEAGESQENNDSIREQLKWVEILRKSLDSGDFEMHFQPIVPVDKQARPLCEALLRLHDEDGNLGSPGIFIDAAEHFGLIQQLDLCVLDRCIATQVDFAKKGFDADMTINLSSRSLGDPDVVKTLEEVVGKYDLNPQNFILEVTETAALHDPSAFRDIEFINNFVNKLKNLGFKFAIDDFGSGFSSFSYLRKLDIDVLKIDGSFVVNLDESPTDRLFLESLVNIAKGLGIKTIAEFVETPEVLRILQEIGIDYAQGYYMSRPRADLDGLWKDFNGKTMGDFLVEPGKMLSDVKKEKSNNSASAKKVSVKKAKPKTVAKSSSKASKTQE